MRTQTATSAESYINHRFLALAPCLFLLVVVLAGSTSMPAATGYANEISNLRVENVTQTSADIVWDTVHPSTSQAIIARDTNYQPEMRVPWTTPTIATTNVNTVTGSLPGALTGTLASPVSNIGLISPNGALVNHHRVTVTGLRPYNA